MTNRINWVDSNIEGIINCNTKSELFINADERFTFLACCNELKCYLKDPDNHICRLPIYLDATCNGLQHLSAMIKDYELGSKVNLLASSVDDKPSDLYSLMIDPIKTGIEELVAKNTDFSRLLNLNINRSLVKRSLMTISYGVTKKGVFDKLMDEHFIYSHKAGKINFYKSVDQSVSTNVFTSSDIYQLGCVIYDSLYKVHPNLVGLVKYFNKIVELFNDLNLPVFWSPPSGLRVGQKYIKFVTSSITTKILGKTKKINLNVPDKNVLNKRKQVNAFVPNFIHSMDASYLAMIVNQIYKYYPTISILNVHDCFGTTADNVKIIRYLVISTFIDIYSDSNFLDDFHNNIINYLTTHVDGVVVDNYKVIKEYGDDDYKK